ncbi:MAG: hypothetical protein K2J12_03045 [Muribaculaceae bacterium]|nr:hypothetical protein [Muribaculaceae bacterium]
MKKLFTLALFCLSVSLFHSCDSEQSRKDKAEDTIRKHLFEILPDYNSYELISLELDTIKEGWISSPEIIELGWDYLTALEDRSEINDKLSSLQSELRELEQRVGMEFVFGNSNYAVMHGGPQLTKMKKAVEKVENKRDSNNEIINNLTKQILNKYDSISGNDTFTGWHAVNKFRSNNIVGTPGISTRHYYLTPDFKNIIISWDDDDETADTPIMINHVSQLIDSKKSEETDSII